MADQNTPPTEAASPTDDHAEFASAFDEFAGAPAPDTQEEDSPQRRKDDPARPDPPPETEPEPKPEPEPEPAPEDPWAAVPEALRKQYEVAQREQRYWAHRYQSDVGRLTAYQNKIKELEAKVNASRGEGSPAPDSQPAPSQGQVQAALDDPKKWDAFAEDYPEVAEAISPLRSRIGTLQTQFERLQQQLSPIEANHRQQRIRQGLDIVSIVHPDWEEVVRQPDFHQWLGQQTPTIQALANSDDPNEAIAALDYYKSWTYRHNRQSAPQPAAPAAAPADSTVEQIQRRREQQLAQMETVPNRGQAAQQTVPPDDFEAAFNAFARARER